MNKKTAIPILIGAGLLMTAGSAFAYVSDDAKQALESRDYDAYIEAVEGTRHAGISEVKFETKADRFETKKNTREALSANDYDAFTQAVADTRKSNISEEKFGELVQRYEVKEDRKSAVELGDYNAFAATFAGTERSAPSAATFELIKELHAAQVSGDREAVSVLRDKLGETGEWKGHKRVGKRGGERGGERVGR